jgi:hypothetical protein
MSTDILLKVASDASALSRQRWGGISQPRRGGERNEALDPSVYAMAASDQHGLRLIREVGALDSTVRKGAAVGAIKNWPGHATIIRSSWMG